MEFLILFNNVRTVTDRTTQPTQHHDNNFCYFILFSVRGKKIILLDPLLKIWTNSQVKVTIMQSYSRTQSLPLNLKWAIVMLYKSQINKVNTAGRLGLKAQPSAYHLSTWLHHQAASASTEKWHTKLVLSVEKGFQVY